jgi:uncharacterized RDD family membrane protein YckC
VLAFLFDGMLVGLVFVLLEIAELVPRKMSWEFITFVGLSAVAGFLVELGNGGASYGKRLLMLEIVESPGGPENARIRRFLVSFLPAILLLFLYDVGEILDLGCDSNPNFCKLFYMVFAVCCFYYGFFAIFALVQMGSSDGTLQDRLSGTRVVRRGAADPVDEIAAPPTAP